MQTSFVSRLRHQPNGPVSIALYVAGAVVQISGLAAVSFQLGVNSFATFTIGLTLIGTLFSYVLRRAGIRANVLKIGVVALAIVFIYALRRATIFGLLLSDDQGATPDMILVSALAFTATFGSFLLLTDDAVVFTCVWTIAMIGLTGTVNINAELPICFVVFLAAAAFLLVHQNAIRFGAGSTQSLRPWSDRFRLLRTQFAVALVAWGAALLLGFLIAIPVQMVGRNMSLAAIMQRLQVPLGGQTRSSPHLNFNDSGSFTVGLGPVDDDPRERLAVLTDGPYYWRGRTYDRYTGHGWINGQIIPGTPMSMMPPTGMTLRQPVPGAVETDAGMTFDVAMPDAPKEAPNARRRITTDFHEEAGIRGPLFHTGEPVTVIARLSQVAVHSDGTIGVRDGDGETYRVVSDISKASSVALRQSSTRYSRGIADSYLDTSDIPEAVSALATEAVSQVAGNPFDRATAIRRFVARRCSYAKLARAVPSDRDAVDFFLNESHEGYCDLFASAMATLARCAGLPARVVTGFAPGQALSTPPGYFGPGANPTGRVSYRLTGNDLHAWAEIYFVGYGWIVFDPTVETSGAAPVAAASPQKKATPFLLGLLQRAGVPLLLGVLALLTVFAAGLNEARVHFTRVRRANDPYARAPAAAHFERDIAAAYHKALRRMSRSGTIRSPASTPGEFVRQVGSIWGDEASMALRALTTLHERASFAGAADLLTRDDSEQAKTALRDLGTALKRARRDRK